MKIDFCSSSNEIIWYPLEGSIRTKTRPSKGGVPCRQRSTSAEANFFNAVIFPRIKSKNGESQVTEEMGVDGLMENRDSSNSARQVSFTRLPVHTLGPSSPHLVSGLKEKCSRPEFSWPPEYLGGCVSG